MFLRTCLTDEKLKDRVTGFEDWGKNSDKHLKIADPAVYSTQI